MLDVHALSDKIEGLKDFGLHILTITIGLLIALSLEGLVEYQHHRHLVNAARASLRGEIERNSKSLNDIQREIDDAQKILDKDLNALSQLRKDAVAKSTDMNRNHIRLEFNVQGFENTAWKTAQATGALTYMPYDEAGEYSAIYDTQDEVYKVQQQVVDDVLHAAALIAGKGDDFQAGVAAVDEDNNRVTLIKMRLTYEKSLVESLSANYAQFKADHP